MDGAPNPDLPVQVLYPNSGPDGEEPDSRKQSLDYDDDHLSDTSLQQAEHYRLSVQDYDAETFLKLAKAVLETEGVNYEDWKETMMNRHSDGDFVISPSHSGSPYYSDSAHSSYDYSDSDEPRNASSGGLDYDDSREGLKQEEEEEEEEEVASTKSSSDEEKPTTPLMGMKSFKQLETKVLVKYLMKTDDERMNELRKKLKKLKKVEAPRVYKVKHTAPKEPTGKLKKAAKKVAKLQAVLTAARKKLDALDNPESKEEEIEVIEEEQEKEEEEEEDDEEEEEEEEEDAKSYHSSQDGTYKFTSQEWALKNTLSFLRKIGCPGKKPPAKKLDLDDKKYDARIRTFLRDERFGAKRRGAIGELDDEMTPAERRLAERGFLRSIIRSSKPKFPLGRFILPQYRRLQKIERSLIGPGSYEVESLYDEERLKRLNSVPSGYKSCSSRFPKTNKSRPPACDAFTNSWKIWEAAVDHYRHPGKVTMFQSPPYNFREHALVRGFGVAPNHYRIKSPIQQFLDKKVCIKTMFESGDFDVCKEARPTSNVNVGPGTYEIRSSIRKNLIDRHNNFKGKFSETPREKMFGFREAFIHPLWPVDIDLPNAATYSPYAMEDKTQENFVPFGTTARMKPPILQDDTGRKILACSDYYFYAKTIKGIEEERTGILGDGWRFNFYSKSRQTISDEQYTSLKERNKALNHKWDQDDILREKKVSGDPLCDT